MKVKTIYARYEYMWFLNIILRSKLTHILFISIVYVHTYFFSSAVVEWNKNSNQKPIQENSNVGSNANTMKSSKRAHTFLFDAQLKGPLVRLLYNYANFLIDLEQFIHMYCTHSLYILNIEVGVNLNYTQKLNACIVCIAWLAWGIKRIIKRNVNFKIENRCIVRAGRNQWILCTWPYPTVPFWNWPRRKTN